MPLDPRYPHLLAACRSWAAAVKTVPLNEDEYNRKYQVVLDAIAAFEDPPPVKVCEHARQWHVFHGHRVECGHCGEVIALPVRAVTTL